MASVSVSLGAFEGPEEASSVMFICDVSWWVSEGVVISAAEATVAELGVVKPCDFVTRSINSAVSLSE